MALSFVAVDLVAAAVIMVSVSHLAYRGGATSPCYAAATTATVVVVVIVLHEGAPMLMLAKETERRFMHAVKM
jgi:hypothetical protein